MSTPRQQLRERLRRGETLVVPGAYDPLGALVVQALGFPAVYVGGYSTGAHTAITEPLLTLSEQVAVARRVARAVAVPVLADAGTGYGDALHVMRCVREFEAAGLAGIHLEDQVYPKRASYHKGLEHIVPLEVFLERLTYARQARRDPDFLLIARTDAFSAVEGGREELVRRGRALRDLGVDAIMPRGVRQREDLAFFRQAVPDVPLVVIAGADDLSVQEYAALGYQLILYATTPAVVTVHALHEAYRHLKETGRLPLTAQQVAAIRAQLEALIGLPALYQVEAETTEKGH
ncbi:MAG: putative 2-methylisocitrate lyase 1 [Candidatus Tectimicrobiota bacterium]|nr:MAG: putative 2-methylisocitrate lyase 1 [Candidatus Tectomicrobia bacterium]